MTTKEKNTWTVNRYTTKSSPSTMRNDVQTQTVFDTNKFHFLQSYHIQTPTHYFLWALDWIVNAVLNLRVP